MYERLRRLVQFSAGGDGGTGGGAGGAGGGGESRRSSADVLQQYGSDAIRLADRISDLEKENYRYRDQRRESAERIKALEAKQVPEGAVVLQGEDATAYQAYTALGKPADLTKRLAEAETATTRLTTLERDAVIRDVAAVAGYKPQVLQDRAGALPLVIKEVTGEDGKPVKRAFITPEGQGEQELTAYARAQWADYLPALVASGTGGATNTGVSFPTTPGGGGQGPRSIVDSFIAQRNEAASKVANPLAPAAAAR